MQVERGEVSAQTVIAIPVVFLFLMIAVQATVYVHTAHVASVAAMNAAALGASAGGSDIGALTEAAYTIAELSARSSEAPTVLRDGETVLVQVSLAVPRVAPFFDLTVTRSAREPIERFVSEIDR